jgi:hypothetical protein
MQRRKSTSRKCTESHRRAHSRVLGASAERRFPNRLTVFYCCKVSAKPSARSKPVWKPALRQGLANAPATGHARQPFLRHPPSPTRPANLLNHPQYPEVMPPAYTAASGGFAQPFCILHSALAQGWLEGRMKVACRWLWGRIGVALRVALGCLSPGYQVALGWL